MFAPQQPHPRYLDFYDLRSVQCGTLGLHPENRFRLDERSAFIKRFFNGYNMFGCQFNHTTADGIDPGRPLVDTDMGIADAEDLIVLLGVSTGAWPAWAQNQMPQFLDQAGQLQKPSEIAAWAYPEAFGLTSSQRRETSLRYLGDVVER